MPLVYGATDLPLGLLQTAQSSQEPHLLELPQTSQSSQEHDTPIQEPDTPPTNNDLLTKIYTVEDFKKFLLLNGNTPEKISQQFQKYYGVIGPLALDCSQRRGTKTEICTNNYTNLVIANQQLKEKNPGGGRIIKECIKMTTDKYIFRNSPPYPANKCKSMKKMGNDGNTYLSQPDKNGTYKWVNKTLRVKKKATKEDLQMLVKKYEVTKSGSNREVAERLVKVRGKFIKNKKDRKIIEYFLHNHTPSTKQWGFVPHSKKRSVAEEV